jgi:CDP-diacylglycerol--glycerol-3-phosphate 3-phosphatidyltransferase
MLTRSIGRALARGSERVAPLLARTRIHPNLLTSLGLFISLWAAVSFAAGKFLAAGGLMILAAACDWLDGPVARVQGRSSSFGEFFDSIIDNYSELVLFLGLLFYYARVNRFLYAVLVCVAMAGSVMVSYVRARSESLARAQELGFWERPERLALLIIGALASRMPPALWVLAVGPNLGVIQRILHTRKQIRGTVSPAPEPAERGRTAKVSGGLAPSSHEVR